VRKKSYFALIVLVLLSACSKSKPCKVGHYEIVNYPGYFTYIYIPKGGIVPIYHAPYSFRKFVCDDRK
jgi:hypothetical protein